MWNAYFVSVLDFCLVQYAVGWSWSVVRVVLCLQWQNFASVYAVQLVYGFGEVVPAAHAFV